MPTSNSNKRRLAACAAWLCCLPALAQERPPAVAPDPLPPASTLDDTGDPLFDALTCRSGAEVANLLPRLRRERPHDFTQTERQYSDPPMDLYRLDTPVQAWGHRSDAIVLTASRVLMVVEGDADQAAAQLEAALAQGTSAPLSGPLDEQHALVLYTEQRPGLARRVLIGCEYRLPDLSLLDDPADAWRRPPASVAPVAPPAATPPARH